MTAIWYFFGTPALAGLGMGALTAVGMSTDRNEK